MCEVGSMSQQSVIGSSTVVRGNVNGLGSLEIQGRVEGTVTMTGEVVVAASALVKGDITGSQISVAGSVAGNLTATEGLSLETGAKVIGDLVGVSIGIAEGALVRGLVRTAGEAPLAPKVVPVPVAAKSPVAARPAVGAAARPATPAPAAKPATPAFARPAAPAPAPAKPPPPAPPPPPPPAPPPVAEFSVEDTEEYDEPAESLPDPALAKLSVTSQSKAGGPPPPVAPALKKPIKAKKKGR
jgi:cytoskeletal protein CcmA (bactofilin family)